MSRRQLMRAAAAAGAAAWTAPAILDSVSSAAFAAAASGCIRYYAKLDVSEGGECYPANPACGYTVPSGTRYVCCSGSVQNEPCPYPEKLPTMVTASTNSGYWEVTLQSGCYFPTTATWQFVGNWNFDCVQLTGAASDAAGPNGQYSGNGYFQAGGRKGWVKKTRNSTGLSYIYTLFCCGS